MIAQPAPQRAVAITIDDLPAASANGMTGKEILEMTTKLLATLKEQKAPAVGFVNEQKLYKFGEVDDRIAALNMWLDQGFELGNHTFKHTSLNRVPLQAWEEDVVRGETVTRILLYQHHMKMRYLRHPYLDVGLDLQTRREAEAFLSRARLPDRASNHGCLGLDVFGSLCGRAETRGHRACRSK